MAVYTYIAAPPGSPPGSSHTSSSGNARPVSGKTLAPVRGTVTADSPRQARDQLRAQGLRVRDLTEQRPGSGQSLIKRYLVGRQGGKVSSFLQEVATLLGAGIPLLETLDTIVRQHQGRFRRSILVLREHVAGGGSLAEAMAQQSVLFDATCVSIVEVGENAGTLDEALGHLVGFRRQAAGLKNRVASALIYPAVVMSVGVAISLFLMTYVVPKLLGVLIYSGKPLPFATLVVKGASDFLLGWWWGLLLGGVVLAAGFGAVLRRPWGQMAWHRFLLKLPVLGDLIRKQGIARMAMVMAVLLKNDVVFVKACRVASRTVGNRVLRDALEACEQAVVAGRDISVALEKSGAFPPLVIQVFAVGQASGRLEAMLEDLARDYDTQVEIASGRFTALLEPIMMILLAISVGFIAFATILPILEAGNVL